MLIFPYTRIVKSAAIIFGNAIQGWRPLVWRLLVWELFAHPLRIAFWPIGRFEHSQNENNYDGLPARTVCMPTFLIDKYEVTTGDFELCVATGECSATYDEAETKCNYGRDDRVEHPMNCMTWTQAHNYCAFVGKRLATEAEWEKAARGSDARVYPWGTDRDNPQGPGNGDSITSLKTIKGGSYYELFSTPGWFRSSSRVDVELEAEYTDVGFRCAMCDEQ